MRIRPHLFVAILSMAMGIMLAAQSPSPRPTPLPGVSIPSTLPQPSATTPSTRTGIIRGQVVRADTGQPLRKAQVSVRLPSPLETRTATTDTNGRYELKGLPPSRYAPFARRNGYALSEYGQKDPNTPGQQIELGEGQAIERIDFALRAGAAIAGRVLDESGEPLAGAQVQAETVGRGIAALDVTDDLGQFRLFGLDRGSYVVAVAPPAPLQPDTIMERRSLGPFTYYPGTLVKDEARRVQVDTGSEVTGLAIASAVSIPFTSQALAQVSAPLQRPPRDQATSEATRTAVVRGRVTRLDNGQPLRGVLVGLNGYGLRGELADFTALTDGAGRFELPRLQAASYTVAASKGGFETLQYGQQRPNQPGRPIDLADGATFEVNLALPRGGVVTGRLVDEDGEPVSGATVRLLRQRYVSGQRRLSSSVAAPDTTNDRGEFRIYGIPPGTYFLSGTQAEPGEPGRPPNGLDSRDAVTTFYPGTPSPDTAQPVTVGPGQELSGLTLRSLPPPRLASISVTLSTPDTSRLPGKALELTRRLATGASSSRTAGLGPDGSFTWMNLPPGEYDISSRALLLRSGEFARAHVTLDGVDAKVALSLVKGGTVRGRVTLDADAGSQPPQPGSLRIGAVSTDPAETTATAMFLPPNADMTFEGVLTPGTRLLRPSLPGWVTKRIRVGDLDITDTPLDLRGTDVSGIEIVLTNRLTDVTGTITDASGRQTGDATVVLFADDASKWGHQTRFVAVVRPNQNGRFTQRGLPPARYVAVALEYLEPGEETNPETLKRLQGLGVRFTLGDRESKTLGLTLTNLP